LAAAAGFHALPEKGVVPDLGGVVEDGRLVRRADGFLDYLS
jgi:hypothetical protein